MTEYLNTLLKKIREDGVEFQIPELSRLRKLFNRPESGDSSISEILNEIYIGKWDCEKIPEYEKVLLLNSINTCTIKGLTRLGNILTYDLYNSKKDKSFLDFLKWLDGWANACHLYKRYNITN